MDVTIIDVTGTKTAEATVPGNAPAGRIAAKLVELMELQATGPDGHPIPYQLYHKSSGTIVRDEETLDDAGVRDGDTLRLVPVMAC
jgi:hypothetical protein